MIEEGQKARNRLSGEATRAGVFGGSRFGVQQAMMSRQPMNNVMGVANLAMGGDPMFPRRTGEIDGPGGPKDDKIPAMLSDGEFVFTAKAVENAGGPSAMYNMMNSLDPQSEKPSERM